MTIPSTRMPTRADRPPDYLAAFERLRDQHVVLSRIVRLECLRLGLPIETAETLLSRITHWWLHGTPKPDERQIDPEARIQLADVPEPLAALLREDQR